LFVYRGERVVENLFDSAKEVGWTFKNSNFARWFNRKFPRTYTFVGNRLRRDSFCGLPLTFLTLSIALLLTTLLDVTRAVLVSDTIVRMDNNLENLLVLFRDSVLVKIFLAITAFGGWQVVITLVLTAGVILWIWNRSIFSLAILFATTGSFLSSYGAKFLINRVRPGGDIPVYTEHSLSFPSSHAALAMTVFGMFLYIFWRNFKNWRLKANLFFAFITVILLIGFSRLYLGVHFLSDVIGGYIIGGMWVLLGISLSEWLISKEKRFSWKGALWLDKFIKSEAREILFKKTITALLSICFVFFSISFIINYNPIFNVVSQTAERKLVVRDINDPLFEKYIPKFPEDLTGDYKAPINFIIVSPDDETTTKSIEKSGWTAADNMNFGSMYQLISKYFKRQKYDNAPIAPLFWHGRPNDFAFEKVDMAGEYGARNEIRIWKTNIALEDGNYIYIGSANYDIRSEYAIFHTQSINLDTSRDLLFKDMMNASVVSYYERRKFVDKMIGGFFEKEKYFTDNKAYFVYISID
jgi:undecaprenyl-diphosphatase